MTPHSDDCKVATSPHLYVANKCVRTWRHSRHLCMLWAQWNVHCRLMVVLVWQRKHIKLQRRFHFAQIWFCYFPICFLSCVYFIIKSVRSCCFLLEMGWLLKIQCSKSGLFLSISLCVAPFSFFSLSTNCFLSMPSWTCHLLVPFLVFPHPSFSSHLYVSMCVSRCAR